MPTLPNWSTSKLANGTELHVLESDFPICCMEIQLPFGFATSSSFPHGSAHVLEHTQLISSTDYPLPYSSDKAIGALGGNSNAATYATTSTHWVDIPQGAEAAGAALLIERVLRSTFNQASIDRERDIIAREKDEYPFFPAKSESSHYFYTKVISDAVTPDLVFGSPPTLSVSDLEQLHRMATMSPGLHILTTSALAASCLRPALESLSISYPAPTHQLLPYTLVKSQYHSVALKQVHTPRLEFCWLSDALTYDTWVAISAILTLLTNHIQGPLYEEYRENRGLVYSMDSYCQIRGSQCLYGLSFPVANQHDAEIIRSSLASLISSALIDDGFVEKEITRQSATQVYYYQSAGSCISAASKSLLAWGKVYSPADYILSLKKLREPLYRRNIEQTYFGAPSASLIFLPKE
jgi:predicted Zn-dependent peptidase